MVSTHDARMSRYLGQSGYLRFNINTRPIQDHGRKLRSFISLLLQYVCMLNYASKKQSEHGGGGGGFEEANRGRSRLPPSQTRRPSLHKTPQMAADRPNAGRSAWPRSSRRTGQYICITNKARGRADPSATGRQSVSPLRVLRRARACIPYV